MLLLFFFAIFARSLAFSLPPLKECRNLQGVDYADTALAINIKSLTDVDAPQPVCGCKRSCTRDKVVIERANCTTVFDACQDNCQLPCTPETCSDLIPSQTYFSPFVCHNVDTEPCNCCVKTPEQWLAVCNNTDFQDNCGKICELCITTCGFTWCEWLNPNIPHLPFSPTQQHIIAAVIAIILDIQYTNPCVPPEVSSIVGIISGLMFQGKCDKIDTCAGDILLLDEFLAGDLGMPICVIPPPTPFGHMLPKTRPFVELKPRN